MELKSKRRSIQLISEIRQLDSSLNEGIKLIDIVDIEAKLNDEERKDTLFKVVMCFSVFVTLAVLTLLFLVAFGKASLDCAILIPLSMEPVSAVLSFFYILVKYYWPSSIEDGAELYSGDL